MLLAQCQTRTVGVLPESAQKADPLYRVFIRKQIDGKYYFGRDSEINFDPAAREFVYLIKYADGDLEHLDATEMRSLQFAPQ